MSLDRLKLFFDLSSFGIILFGTIHFWKAFISGTKLSESCTIGGIYLFLFLVTVSWFISGRITK